MFPRQLTSAIQGTTSLKPSGNYKHEFEISDTGYGKDHVKILHIRREGNVHHIKEFEVNTHLKLYSKKDYLMGKKFPFDLTVTILISKLIFRIILQLVLILIVIVAFKAFSLNNHQNNLVNCRLNS